MSAPRGAAVAQLRFYVARRRRALSAAVLPPPSLSRRLARPNCAPFQVAGITVMPTVTNHLPNLKMDEDKVTKLIKAAMEYNNKTRDRKSLTDKTDILSLVDQLKADNREIPHHPKDSNYLFQNNVTYKTYQQLKSTNSSEVIQALWLLMGAGGGASKQGVGYTGLEWEPTNKNFYYKLYTSGVAEDFQPKAGHLELLVGEVALTFEHNKPCHLTYKKDDEEVVLQGFLAIAVSLQPLYFRACSTWHRIGPHYECVAHTYKMLHDNLADWLSKGATSLSQWANQHGPATGQGQGAPPTETIYYGKSSPSCSGADPTIQYWNSSTICSSCQ